MAQGVETAIAHLATYKLGAIAVPLFTMFAAEALDYRLANSGGRLVVTDHVGLAQLAELLDRLTSLEHHVSIVGREALDCAELLARSSDGLIPLTHKANYQA